MKAIVEIKWLNGRLFAKWMDLCVDASGAICPGKVSGWIPVVEDDDREILPTDLNH